MFVPLCRGGFSQYDEMVYSNKHLINASNNRDNKKLHEDFFSVVSLQLVVMSSFFALHRFAKPILVLQSLLCLTV